MENALSAQLGAYTKIVEAEMRRVLDAHGDLRLYAMMRYFLGFADDNANPAAIYGGKRFRPALCLLLAEAYGQRDMALEVAASLELFHNFTLIHDDIEDHDEMRRGRPTVWKLWGVNHGINTGDAQLILALSLLGPLLVRDTSLGMRVQKFLLERYLEVIEGQFFDFTLADARLNDPMVNEKAYMRMIGKKSAVLVGAAAKSAGMVAGKREVEEDMLWQYGYNLGLAYQLYDDLVSIWGDEKQSGKVQFKDIVERKKTLPILYLYGGLSGDEAVRLCNLYAQNSISEEDSELVVRWLNGMGVYERVWDRVVKHADRAKKVAVGLHVTSDIQKTLVFLVDGLLPKLRG